jgi:voltage-gated potassium channel
MKIKEKLYTIIFETDTRAGKNFDLVLLWLILFSIVLVMLESVPEIGSQFNDFFFYAEWILTVLFSLEYLIRVFISPKPLRYIFSFWGLIDLLSIMPSYLSLFLADYHYLMVVRIFRLLRIFRVLKLARFLKEAQMLTAAIKSSYHKMGIFLFAVLAIVTFMGTIMYVVEGGQEGFTSIPNSIYWAVVTVTTVGYGDIVPHTAFGKFISSIAMIIGYAIIAVPTGIVTSEMTKSIAKSRKCNNCKAENNIDSNYCSNCGEALKG